MARQLINTPTFGQTFGEGLGSTLSKILQNRLANQIQQEQEKEVRQRQMQTYGALGKVLQQETPEGQNKAAFMLQQLGQQPDLDPSIVQSMIGRNLMQQSASPFGQFVDPSLLQSMGMDQDTAQIQSQLYNSSSIGGKTQITKNWVDMMQRGMLGGAAQGVPQVDQPSGQVEEIESATYSFPELETFSNLTPQERVSRQNQLRKENKEIVDNTSTKLKSTRDIGKKIGQLDRINERRNIPEGVLKKKLLLDANGNIRIPEFANKDTELFIKLINDFTTQAKDSYGSRVTNFDLAQFMKRLPTLMNTYEGRRVILSTLDTMNKMDNLYHDSRSKVIREYGSQNIAPEKIDEIAENLRANEEKLLLDKYENLIEKDDLLDYVDKAPNGFTPAKGQDGKLYYIPVNMKQEAIARGAIVLDD